MDSYILVIDPDLSLPESGRRTRELQRLVSCLERDGYGVDAVFSLDAGLHSIARTAPDLIILHTSRSDGASLCAQLRDAAMVPIVMLSPRTRPEEIARGLESGAAAYVDSGFDEDELLARLRTLLRRARAPRSSKFDDVIRIGDIEIDSNAREVRRAGRPISLSPTQFRLLEVLARRAGAVLPHRVLLTEVWGPQYVDDVQYLRTYIRSLREKLEDEPNSPRHVLTERGIGYRLAEPDDASAHPARPPL